MGKQSKDGLGMHKLAIVAAVLAGVATGAWALNAAGGGFLGVLAMLLSSVCSGGVLWFVIALVIEFTSNRSRNDNE